MFNKNHIQYRITVLLLALLPALHAATAQTALRHLSTPLPLQKEVPYYTCINYSANTLRYPADSSRMELFYSKLDTLSLFGTGQINIVHIGGSHIQADIMTNRLRQNLTQCIPGFDASRGIIFPFKAARTNNPTNYTISYTGSWRKCQNSLPPIDRVLGVTGISVSTDDRYASVSFHLNPEGQNTDWHYSRLRLMASVADSTLTPALIINTDTIAPYSISNNCTSHIPDSIPPLSPTLYYTYTIPYSADFGTITLIPNDILYRARQHDSHFHDTVHTDTTILSADTTLTLDGELNIGLESDNASVVNRSDITFPNTIVDDKLFTINGIIPETDNNGITLHSIGVNGASLPSWLRCADFAQQIQMLKPDLVIMAVGVNDANVGYGRFDKNEYIANYNLLIDRIYAVNPNCAIIFVTNNDCVLRTGRRSHGPNKNTALVAEAMTSLARQHNGAVWNLYDIMGGLGSMAVWRDNGLANPDRVHFLAPGYTILGDMLYNAIIYDWLYKQKSE